MSLQKDMSLLLRTLLQSDPRMIKEIVDAVTIPVMAKVRIGHFVEAQVRAATAHPTRA